MCVHRDERAKGGEPAAACLEGRCLIQGKQCTNLREKKRKMKLNLEAVACFFPCRETLTKHFSKAFSSFSRLYFSKHNLLN